MAKGKVEAGPSGGALLVGKDKSFARARVTCASGRTYEADENTKLRVHPEDVGDCVRAGWAVAE